jgi:hypothetical protein
VNGYRSRSATGSFSWISGGREVGRLEMSAPSAGDGHHGQAFHNECAAVVLTHERHTGSGGACWWASPWNLIRPRGGRRHRDCSSER